MNINIFFDIALSLYILTFLHITLHTFMGYKNLIKITNIFASVGVLFNIADIAIRWTSKSFTSSTISDVLAVTSLFLMLITIYIYIKFSKSAVYLINIPAVIVTGSFSLMLQNLSGKSGHYAEGFWLYIHLPFTIAGTSLFFISALSGLIYFIQEKRLKKKKFGGIFDKLPPIDVLNKININTIMVGFTFFTVGLIAGIIWGFYEWQGRLLITPKLLFAIITWCIFGTILLIKKVKGMSPKSTALWSVIGILSVIITYFGLALFLKGR